MRHLSFKKILLLLFVAAFVAMGSWYYLNQLQKLDIIPDRADLVMASPALDKACQNGY